MGVATRITDRRAFLRVVAFTIGVVMASAVTQETSARAASRDAVLTLLRVETSNETIPWTVSKGSLPTLLLTGNRVLLADPVRYRVHPVLEQMVALPATPARVGEVLGVLRKTPLLLDPTLLQTTGPVPPGTSTTRITYTLGRRTAVVEVVGLDSTKVNASLNTAQREARTTLRDALDRIQRGRYWGATGTARYFVPTEISAWGMRLPTEGLDVGLVAGTTNVKLPFSETLSCAAIAVSDAARIPGEPGDLIGGSNGAVYQLVLRPVLPGETLCQ
jgi:hypothetical protein